MKWSNNKFQCHYLSLMYIKQDYGKKDKNQHNRVTWHNNNVRVSFAEVRVTESGNVLPVDWWPIKSQKEFRVYFYVCADITPWIRHGLTVRTRNTIGSHHSTKVLRPITNLQLILYVAWMGGGLRGWRWIWRPKCRVSNHQGNYFQTLFFYLYMSIIPHSVSVTV